MCFSISVLFCTDAVRAHCAEFFQKIAMLKRHVLSAPLKDLFEKIEAKSAGSDLHEIRYRDDEGERRECVGCCACDSRRLFRFCVLAAFFLKPEGDRCVMIFSIHFKDADDVVFSKVRVCVGGVRFCDLTATHRRSSYKRMLMRERTFVVRQP
jgi:hypothetical protein